MCSDKLGSDVLLTLSKKWDGQYFSIFIVRTMQQIDPLRFGERRENNGLFISIESNFKFDKTS